MNIEKLLQDHSIPYMTQHKNVRDGWIGMDCPFCGTTEKYHMGYNLDEDYFSCWQCGGHSHKGVIARLLGVTYSKAEDILSKYGGKPRIGEEHRIKVSTKQFALPTTVPFNKQALHYLEKRGFSDPEQLIATWDLKYTGPSSKLDGLNYGNRILAPIYWNQRLVSFQARDITNRHPAKYMACPPERERISHKHILYGPLDVNSRKAICVEGIVDTWKLGVNTFCTFGVKYTSEQLRLMVRLFDELIVLFDPEEIAQKRARNLVQRFQNYKGKKARVEVLSTDPGDLDEKEAIYIAKNLMKY